jgi:hypothetical protein
VDRVTGTDWDAAERGMTFEEARSAFEQARKAFRELNCPECDGKHPGRCGRASGPPKTCPFGGFKRENPVMTEPEPREPAPPAFLAMDQQPRPAHSLRWAMPDAGGEPLTVITLRFPSPEMAGAYGMWLNSTGGGAMHDAFMAWYTALPADHATRRWEARESRDRSK